jgi:hypothetical protein
MKGVLLTSDTSAHIFARRAQKYTHRRLSMSLRQLVAIGLLSIMLTACGGGGPATAGEPKEFEAVCEKANDGKRIATEGYLRFPSSFTDSASVVLRLYKDTDFRSTPIGVETHFGTQANQLQNVNKEFSQNDLKVHLANGQTAGYGTKVKVSGTVYFPIVAQEFPCSLSNPLVELAK